MQEAIRIYSNICGYLGLGASPLTEVIKINSNLFRGRISDPTRRLELLAAAPKLKRSRDFQHIYIQKDLTYRQRMDLTAARNMRRRQERENSQNPHESMPTGLEVGSESPGSVLVDNHSQDRGSRGRGRGEERRGRGRGIEFVGRGRGIEWGGRGRGIEREGRGGRSGGTLRVEPRGRSRGIGPKVRGGSSGEVGRGGETGESSSGGASEAQNEGMMNGNGSTIQNLEESSELANRTGHQRQRQFGDEFLGNGSPLSGPPSTSTNFIQRNVHLNN